MRCTFDPAKNELNKAAHHVDLADAELLDWAAIVAVEDTRKAYSEVRMVGYAPIGARLYCVVYTDRTDGRRIISLRKANSREVARYEQAD